MVIETGKSDRGLGVLGDTVGSSIKTPRGVNIEDQDGVGSVRGDRGDIAVVFSGRSFLNNIDYLAEKCTVFASRNLGWSREATASIIGTALNVNRLTGGRELTSDVIEMIMDDSRKSAQVPSVILIRKALADPGQYFATSAQRKFFIPTSEGEKPVLFHILRSVDNVFRGRNTGRWMIDLLRIKHEADYYIHRSSNPMALVTNMKSPNLRQEGRIPFDRPYYTENPGGSIEHGIEYEIAKVVLAITVGDQYKLDANGVVKGLYREQNKAYDPDPRYPATYELYQQMIRSVEDGGWGMDLPAGDTSMPIYRIK